MVTMKEVLPKVRIMGKATLLTIKRNIPNIEDCGTETMHHRAFDKGELMDGYVFQISKRRYISYVAANDGNDEEIAQYKLRQYINKQ